MSVAAPGAAVTPTGMLARVRAVRGMVMTGEAELLVLAAEWADAHPDLDEDTGGEPYPAKASVLDEVEDAHPDEDPLIPAVAWDAGAPFAAALGRSTASGDALIRDALILRHRLPRVWARIQTGQVEVWRARRIAATVAGKPADVAETLDDTLARIAHKVGPITLDRLLDEAMLRLYPEDRELAQLEALDHRHVTLHEETLNHTGIAELTIRGDWKDLKDFDDTITALAAALAVAAEAESQPPESLDVRRSIAVGVLADPAAAVALLEDRPAPKPRKRTHLFVHLSQAAVAGLDPIGCNQTTGRAVLEQQIRDWCGRTDTHLTVTGVIDLNDHTTTGAYQAADRLRTRIDLIAGFCVFPWCTRPARACDLDHTIPHDQGGATCECNLAPLCRRHHRLKTHAGWRYTVLETGVWLWSDPHGQQFLRDHTGTIDVTPPDRAVNGKSGTGWTGCREGPPVVPRE